MGVGSKCRQQKCHEKYHYDISEKLKIIYQSLAKTNEMKILISRLLAPMYPSQVNRVTLTQVADLINKL